LSEQLNLDDEAEKRPANEQHIVLHNRDEVRRALQRRQYAAPATELDGSLPDSQDKMNQP